MIGAGTIIGITAGASLILNGINNKKSSKYIAKQEREAARIQFEVNKKEVERAYKTNLEGVLKGFATQRADLIDTMEKASSNLNIQLGERKNIDKENDSFKDDSKKMLENEVQENILAMIDHQSFSISELSNQMSMQMYQVGTDFSSTISGINKNKIRADQQSNAMIAEGIMGIGENAFDFYEKNFSKTQEGGVNNFGGETFKAPQLYDKLVLNVGSSGGTTGFGNTNLTLGNYTFSGTGNKFKW